MTPKISVRGLYKYYGSGARRTLALQHVEDAHAQVRRRRQDGILLRLLAVADAGEQITQGIGHRHLLTFTSST